MPPKVVLGTPEAAELQESIQSQLSKFDYAPEDDPVMAEYIIVMLSNNKTEAQITEQLMDLIGDHYDASFTNWIFKQASGEPVAEVKKDDTKPAGVPAEGEPASSSGATAALTDAASSNGPGKGLFNRAVASSTASLGQKRQLDGGASGANESQAKRKVSGNVPTGPRAMAGGAANAGGKKLLSRIGGVDPVQQKADTLQNKIDAITGGAEAAQTLEQQQQQQMLQQMNGMGGMMNGGMGMMGMGGFGMQDIMMAQMAQMQMLQQQMQQMAGMLPQQQQPFSGGPQRSRGGGSGNRGGHHNQQSVHRPAKISSPAALPSKPTDPELCKFALGCTNAACPRSHPSPAASAADAMVLSLEACEKQRDCKDPDCVKSHVSPGAASSSVLPCKYQNCTNPSCPFLHTDAAGKVIPPPALTDPSIAVVRPFKGDSKKPATPHGKQPYARPPPGGGGGGNKSVNFNPKAKSFVPKSHVSDRLAPLAAGGATEKIIPASSIVSTPSAPTAAALSSAVEAKKEEAKAAVKLEK